MVLVAASSLLQQLRGAFGSNTRICYGIIVHSRSTRRYTDGHTDRQHTHTCAKLEVEIGTGAAAAAVDVCVYKCTVCYNTYTHTHTTSSMTTIVRHTVNHKLDVKKRKQRYFISYFSTYY